VVGLCLFSGLTALDGCGGASSPPQPSAQRLESARREGEEAAQERAQIKSLQHKVRHLQREVRKGHPAAVVVTGSSQANAAPETEASTASRIFHAPSGNVSCEVTSSGASCSVDSIDETFTLTNGEEARLETGTALPRGAGELAPYGVSIAVGSVVCSVPESNEPRGITCSNSETGHGFEASRITARQSTY